MSNLTDILLNLKASLLTNYPTATVVFDQITSKGDDTPFPLFEIGVNAKSSPTIHQSNFVEYQIQILYHARTTLDKLTIESIEERNQVSLQMRDLIRAWVIAGNFGNVTNYSSAYDYFEDGQYGSMDNKTIRVLTSFTLKIVDV